MKEGKGRLHSQNSQQQQGRAVNVTHCPTRPSAGHSGVDEASGEVRKAEVEQAGQEKHHQSESKTHTIRAEIAE